MFDATVMSDGQHRVYQQTSFNLSQAFMCYAHGLVTLLRLLLLLSHHHHCCCCCFCLLLLLLLSI